MHGRSGIESLNDEAMNSIATDEFVTSEGKYYTLLEASGIRSLDDLVVTTSAQKAYD